MKTFILLTLLLFGSLSVHAQIKPNDSTDVAVIVPAAKLETITLYEIAKGIFCTESFSIMRQSKVTELQKTKNVIIIKAKLDL